MIIEYRPIDYLLGTVNR